EMADQAAPFARSRVAWRRALDAVTNATSSKKMTDFRRVPLRSRGRSRQSTRSERPDLGRGNRIPDDLQPRRIRTVRLLLLHDPLEYRDQYLPEHRRPAPLRIRAARFGVERPGLEPENGFTEPVDALFLEVPAGNPVDPRLGRAS